MKRLYLGLALAIAPMVTAPAVAQSRSDQQRWDAAQSRYRAETDLYQREWDRYRRVGGGRGGYQQPGGQQGYPQGGPDGYPARPGYPQGGYPQGQGGYPPQGQGGGYDQGGDDRFATDYDASRDYREGGGYQTRQLSANDQVYRGSDGRYYCKRKDGTTGLILGAAGGGLLGNVIDGGRNRVAGTLIGGALGALVGKSVDQNSGSGYSCR